VAGYSVIDVLNHEDRRRLFAELRRILEPGGLLIFSTHNRDAAPDSPVTRLRRGPREAVKVVLRLPHWLGNRRRLVPLQSDEPDYAVLNDSSHDYGALHYYVTAAAQERQLADAGFSLVEYLELDGRTVEPGSTATSTELHFVAR
jgi:SAM-dependent methyltransferase